MTQTSTISRSGGKAASDSLDAAQRRIEAFARSDGRGLAVRKDRHGCTIVREADGEPVARLRPRGADHYAVLYWSRFNQRWRPIGEFGEMILGLDAALDFIAVDPMGCFWF